MHGPQRRLIEAEIKSRVTQGLDELTDPDREILVLRYLEQLYRDKEFIMLRLLGLRRDSKR